MFEVSGSELRDFITHYNWGQTLNDSSTSSSVKVTEILRSWNDVEDAQAEKQLSPILYETMRRLSQRYIVQEKNGYTLQATELVHEAYAMLVDTDIDWQSRQHFYAVAARTMRRILVDRAREKNAIKRGQGFHRITFDESALTSHSQGEDILALEQSLLQLKELDERKASIIELHFFAGLTYQEIALSLEISEATVDRELRFSKAWLGSRLKEDED